MFICSRCAGMTVLQGNLGRVCPHNHFLPMPSLELGDTLTKEQLDILDEEGEEC